MYQHRASLACIRLTCGPVFATMSVWIRKYYISTSVALTGWLSTFKTTKHDVVTQIAQVSTYYILETNLS